jgi:RNA polymerase sigma factor (sigma-70 family)
MNDEQTRARFERLLLPLLTDAYNLARWLMKNQEDAEDMVQDSYVKAFRFFGGFHEGGNCRAWFLRIVRNTCYTSLEARKLKEKEVPFEDYEYDVLEDPAPLPTAILDKSATIQGVRKAVEQLPAEFREALVLREFEGLSYKEIADVSGVPLGTVMSRLARARNQLQVILLEQKKQEIL